MHYWHTNKIVPKGDCNAEMQNWLVNSVQQLFYNSSIVERIKGAQKSKCHKNCICQVETPSFWCP